MRHVVIGFDGLLGGAVCRALLSRGIAPITPDVRWATPEGDEDLDAVASAVTAVGDDWTVYWCAGVGVTSTPQEAFDAELETFQRFCRELTEATVAASQADVDAAGGRGTIFFASSAGALYAGAQNPPFSESSEVVPLGAYGLAKQRLEKEISALTDSGIRVAIGRIANLYGPGQNLAKPQGLISQLCLSAQNRRPIGIYVPLDTMRDYIFADDAAGLVLDFTARVGSLPAGSSPMVKILATGRSTTVAGLVSEASLVAKRQLPLAFAASAAAALQSRDLRFRSGVWPDLDRRPMTPLPVGINACLMAVKRRTQDA